MRWFVTTLDLMWFTILITCDNTLVRHTGIVRAASASLWIMQCIINALWATDCNLALKPDWLPSIAGAPSVVDPISLLKSRFIIEVFDFRENIISFSCRFQWLAHQWFVHKIEIFYVSDPNNQLCAWCNVCWFIQLNAMPWWLLDSHNILCDDVLTHITNSAMNGVIRERYYGEFTHHVSSPIMRETIFLAHGIISSPPMVCGFFALAMSNETR